MSRGRVRSPRDRWTILAVGLVIVAVIAVLLGLRHSPIQVYISATATDVLLDPYGGTTSWPNLSAPLQAIHVTGVPVAVEVHREAAPGRDGLRCFFKIINESDPVTVDLKAVDSTRPFEIDDVTLTLPMDQGGSDDRTSNNTKPSPARAVAVGQTGSPRDFRIDGGDLSGNVSFKAHPAGLVALNTSNLDRSTCAVLREGMPVDLDEIDLTFSMTHASATIEVPESKHGLALSVRAVAFRQPDLTHFVNGEETTTVGGPSLLAGSVNDLSSENRAITLYKGDDLVVTPKDTLRVWLQQNVSGVQVDVSGDVACVTRNGYELEPRMLLWLAQQPAIITAYSAFATTFALFLGVRKWREQK
jgi:hypothetical protein